MERLLTLKHILPELKTVFWPSAENNFRPVFVALRFLIFYAAVFLALKIFIFPFYYFFPQSSFFADVVASTLVSLTNEERAERGLPLLAENSLLTQAAQAKADDMLKNGYFNHVSPQGLTPWYWFKQVGYDYAAAGENLAVGFIDSSELEQAWYNSASHRQNLLNPLYSEIGIAVVQGDFQGSSTTLVVQLFGKPKAANLTVQAKLSFSPTPRPSVSVKPSALPSPSAVVSPSPVFTPSVAPSPTESKAPLAVLGQNQTRISGLSERLVEFSANNYDDLSSSAITLFLGAVVLLLVLSAVRSVVHGRPAADLILETSFFIFLTALSGLLDKSFVINLIPHSLFL